MRVRVSVRLRLRAQVLVRLLVRVGMKGVGSEATGECMRARVCAGACLRAVCTRVCVCVITKSICV